MGRCKLSFPSTPPTPAPCHVPPCMSPPSLSVWAPSLLTVGPSLHAAAVVWGHGIVAGEGAEGGRKGRGREGVSPGRQMWLCSRALGKLRVSHGHRPPCEFQLGWGSRRSQGSGLHEAATGRPRWGPDRRCCTFIYRFTPLLRPHLGPRNACAAFRHLTCPEGLGPRLASSVSSPYHPPSHPHCHPHWGQMCHDCTDSATDPAHRGPQCSALPWLPVGVGECGGGRTKSTCGSSRLPRATALALEGLACLAKTRH